jgi:pimeloyl-ACP methyl ester carboxylesterase
VIRHLRRYAAGLALSLPLLALAPAPAGAATVEIDGHSVRVACSGPVVPGRPVVVLLSGYGDGLDRTSALRERLAGRDRVCAYDRLGEGRSDDPDGVQGLGAVDRVLDGVLDTVAPDQDVVLVGHSLGGLLAARYTSAHPDRVDGLVLLDATGAGTTTDVTRIIPAHARGVAGQLRAQQVEVTSGGGPERLRLRDTPVGPAGDLPVVVVTHRTGFLAASVPAYGAALERSWTRNQRAWLRLSTDSTRVIAPRSGHYVYLDQPGLVVHQVRGVVEQVVARAG